MPVPGFHGRTEELAWLRGLWDACTQRDPTTGRCTGGPRAAFILAESGIGKSRLVQALYQQLTTDAAWDPPEVNYWPDAFNDQGVQLRVTPDMAGHVAKGPPRFAWLGARWQPTDVRNVSDRRSALPELRHSMVMHAEILKRQGGSWADASGRINEAIRKEGLGETISQIADAAVPFGGLLMKIARNAVDFAKDRLEGPRSFEQAEDLANRTLVDEVCECLHSLMDGPGGLPTVLWLDDAQWIDAETQSFVRRIWLTAQRRQWPLLLVITHWEREWRELKKAGGAAEDSAESFQLTSLEGQPGVEVRVLGPAPADSLGGYLQSRLPGLTQAQQALMLEKAAGNFLTMVENVGQLLRMPPNFVGRDVKAALSPAGERKVQEWESERQKRVEQRFGELAPELQEMLGWGSHLGMSFLREVVEEFAERVAGLQSAGAMLEEAVDPLVILGQPSEHLREFRDKAFHHVARRHFHDYGQEHAEALSQILRSRLVEWVNNSFDAEGDEIWPDKDKGIAAPDRSVTSLPQAESRDVLGMAVRALELPEEPDWSDAQHQAALRARFLLVVVDWSESFLDRVQSHCRQLDAAALTRIPAMVLSSFNQGWLAEQARVVGALGTALALRGRALELALEGAKDGMIESRDHLCECLDRVVEIEKEIGVLDAALAKSEQSLVIRRQLFKELGNPQSHRDVSTGLRRLASVRQANGDLEAACAALEESLEISRQILAEVCTVEAHRDLAVVLSWRGELFQRLGRTDDAITAYEASLALVHKCAEQFGTPESVSEVWDLLNSLVGDVLTCTREMGEGSCLPDKFREACQCWAAELEGFDDPDRWHVEPVSAWCFAGTLAAWWSYVSSFESARGNLSAAAAACDKASRWQEREIEFERQVDWTE